MHESQTAPHDPYRKLATAIIAQAVRDYTAPYPHDTGHASVDNRRKQWHTNHATADHFLFHDVEEYGKWTMCCMLMKIDPMVARKDMIKKLKFNGNFGDYCKMVDKTNDK